jgi:Cu2+-exporting ATPase
MPLDARPYAPAPASGTEDRCTLCDLPTPDPPIRAESGDAMFCCAGCREVYRTLDDLDEAAAADMRSRLGGDGASAPATVPDDADEAFLHMDGMHCTACEAFLETMAEQDEGVHRAEASYVSEMVRLRYDAEALPDLLTRAGYTASLDRPDADAASDTAARLLFGGFFTMMVMVWYIVFLYPVYAGGEGLVAVEGEFARYALGNVWLATTVVMGITGGPLFRSAGVSLRVLRPNMDLLVTLAASSAYLYSTGVLLMGGTEVCFDVAVVIVFVVSLGRWVEGRVKDRAVGLLADLTREQVDTARRVWPGGTVASVPADDLTAGDRVRQGERIPVDGVVATGTATVDESLLMGEGRPVTKARGTMNDALTMRVASG